MLRALLCLLVVPSAAFAGGLDHSGQPVRLLFEEGDYVELGAGIGFPRIEGVDSRGADSGNVYGPVGSIVAGVQKRLGGAWSATLIVDRPYGVVVDYPDGDFVFAGTEAKAESLGVTGLLRYRLDRRWSLHGGLRAERFGGDATLDGAGYGPLAGYGWTGDPDWGVGYVLGAAFEVPEIALRVALTYGSEIRHSLEADENFFGPTTTGVTMPRSANLDFQTGLSPRTLLYGQVRWVGWDGWKVEPAGLLAATGMPLIAFDSDVFTYRLGLGRQLTDDFSAAVELAHETPLDRTMTALDPYDGFTGLGLGGALDLPSGLRLAGGVSVNFLGSATVASPLGGRAEFGDSRALAARLSIGKRF
jgi:hypothetical protein